MHGVFGRDDDDAQGISRRAVVMGPTAQYPAAVNSHARPSVAQRCYASMWVEARVQAVLLPPGWEVRVVHIEDAALRACCRTLKIESSFLAFAAVHGAVSTLLNSASCD
jgi:hypothetical protein